ncbi:type I-E CRISPR-associated endoribonuclease Cas2e [Secundilactobacillus silagei]|uniref:type I-E CRISPR-associated endoribonuclease Cas2e n=1 Tax=Secundilactobacillus silagei TaxID=1293415 RepID=UPI000AE47854
MIVITLTKVPPSLRGDLTKWYQEIQTGVYVGNVSARVRDQLWDRVMRDIGNGQATMVYNAKNEFGYQFKTTRKDRRVVDFDDIPLMKRLNTLEEPVKLGFSNASKYHRARLSSRKALKPEHPGHSERSTQLVAIDIETTGLDAVKNQIISIAAFKSIGIKECQHFDAYISIDQPVPENIVKLTGITDSKLKDEGIELVDALRSLKKICWEFTNCWLQFRV